MAVLFDPVMHAMGAMIEGSNDLLKAANGATSQDECDRIMMLVWRLEHRLAEIRAVAVIRRDSPQVERSSLFD